MSGNRVRTAGPELRHPEEAQPPAPTGNRRFAWALAGVLVVAIAARLLFIAGWDWGEPLHGDPLFFQQSAAHLANGRGYVDLSAETKELVPTAEHPPAFTVLLTGLDVIDIRSADEHRIALAFISSLGVVAMGLLGRRLSNARVGLLAAGIAALDPLWVQWGGFVMSESLYLVIVPAMLLFALRCIDRRKAADFFALGLLIGLATLTRSEAIDFVVLLGAVCLLLVSVSFRRWMLLAVVFVAGVCVLLVPWLIRNDVQMGSLTLSTNGGFTLSGSYTDGTFSPSSPFFGGFDNTSQFGVAAVIVKYEKPPDHAKHWDEVTLSNRMGQGAMTWARGHLSDLPGVVLAREGRVWGVYAPGSELVFDAEEDMTGAQGPKQIGQVLNWVVLPLALLGAVLLGRRSPRRLLVIVVPIVVVALNAAVFYGSTRLRVAAQPSLDILAAIGALWIAGLFVARIGRPRGRRDVVTPLP